MPGEPWNKALVDAWEWATMGRRKYAFYPLFGTFVAVGIISAFLAGLEIIRKNVGPSCISKTNESRPADNDVMDEWVLRVASFASEEDAEADRARFVAAMFRDSIKPHLPTNANPEKILVVRDPMNCDRWLEVLDLVPGDGSKQQQERWRDSLNRLSNVDPNSELSRWVRRGQPYYYSREEYERMYGKVEEPGAKRPWWKLW